MASIEKIVAAMRNNPKSIRYVDLVKVCDFYFGKARMSGSSHAIYKTPWSGAPLVNIQNKRSMAKPYQVRQVLLAIAKLEENDGEQ